MVENSCLRVTIDRPLYEQEKLNNELKYVKPKFNGCLHTAKAGCTSCNSKNLLRKILPVLEWLPHYRWKRDFPGDLISGFTVAVMHIPQGMAYSLLGNVPAVVGIYMAFFPVLVYFFFGTSRHNSMGTFAIVCLMTGKAVLEYSDPSYLINSPSSTGTNDVVQPAKCSYSPMEVVSAVTFLVALLQLLMFVFRLGVISSLLSEPLISGFTTASAIQVLTSQVKDLLGITIPNHKGYFVVINTWISVFEGICSTNMAALVISIITIAVVAINNEVLKPRLAKLSSFPVPIELIAVIVGASVSKYWQLTELYNISIVGNIPSGLPEPSLPNISLMSSVAVDALTIAIVSYALALSMALIFAQKLSYEVDANQELLAMGAGNICGSFFSCMPFTASISRSLIQQTVGGKTQITSIISCGILFFVLMWIGPLFEPLPKSILASVIIVSLKGMLMQVTDLLKFWKLSKADAFVWFVTFITVIVVSIDIGLLVGLVLSLSTVIVLGFKPYACLLGVAPSTDIYLDITRYQKAVQVQGVKIFHYRGGINFATRTIFKGKLYEILQIQPQKELKAKTKLAKLEELKTSNSPTSKITHKFDKLSRKVTTDLKYLILDFSAVSYIDPSGVAMIKQIGEEFQRIDISVYVACCSGPVLDTIMKWDLLRESKNVIKLFPTIHDAVESGKSDLDLVRYL